MTAREWTDQHAQLAVAMTQELYHQDTLGGPSVPWGRLGDPQRDGMIRPNARALGALDALGLLDPVLEHFGRTSTRSVESGDQ